MKLRREHIIMGMIQSSLNQLTMSLLGAAVGVGKGLQGGFAPAKTPGEQKLVKDESTKVSDYKVPVGYSNLKPTMYNTSESAAFSALQSGNDMIRQKALSSQVKLKLASIRKRKGK